MIPIEEAQRVVQLLTARDQRVVFAESCTAGLIPALFATVPGSSRCLCGSVVAYRPECKQQWLGITSQQIAVHTTVSLAMSRLMVQAVLARTADADFGAAITGHLGPDAPPALDGRVFIAIANRHHSSGDPVCHTSDWQLRSTARPARQWEAACIVLRQLVHVLQQ